MSMGHHPSSIVGNVGDVRLMFVDDFIPHWISADGVVYEIGERVPVVRIGEALCFNERIGLASCDSCDFVAVAPMTALWRIIYAHQAVHAMEEEEPEASFHVDSGDEDASRHPDFQP